MCLQASWISNGLPSCPPSKKWKWLCVSVVLAFGRLRKEGQGFKVYLSYMMNSRTCLKPNKQNLKKIKEISLQISRTTRDSFLTQESLSIHMKEGVNISNLISKSICYHKKMNEKSDVGEVVDKSSNQVVSMPSCQHTSSLEIIMETLEISSQDKDAETRKHSSLLIDSFIQSANIH